MKKLVMITLITAAACTHSNGQINVSKLPDAELHDLVENCKTEISLYEKEIAEIEQKLQSAKDTLERYSGSEIGDFQPNL
ncbi:hypothetical protein EBR77_02920, partial [bacterium]|nr:hypothetical protein [bacterium]